MSVESRLEERWSDVVDKVPQLNRERERFLRGAERIAGLPMKVIKATLSQKIKEKKKLAAQARRLILAIRRCDEILIQPYWPDITSEFRDKLRLIGMMDRVPKEVLKAATRPGGKRPGAKRDSALKRLTAGETAAMLEAIGITPVTTRGGQWTTLTEHLYYVATGRECKDAQAACIACRDSWVALRGRPGSVHRRVQS